MVMAIIGRHTGLAAARSARKMNASDEVSRSIFASLGLEG